VNEPSDQDASVRHLVELGYFDPADLAANEARLRQKSAATLRDAEEMLRAGRLSDAIGLLNTAAAEDPAWIVPHQKLAAIHYRAGQWNEAEVELDWLTFHGIEHPQLALISGTIALERRQLQRALEYLEYAVYVAPEIPGVLNLLGRAFLRLNRLDDAEAAFQKSLETNSSDAYALDGLAAICLRNREYKKAADFALNALGHDMQVFGAHYRLGIALSFLDRPAGAITALETAARLRPTVAALYWWLARIANVQLKDVKRAKNYYDRGLELVRHRREVRRARPTAT
jgi:tetratricopeptide (TPR) repeat protein